jgi:thioredoxin 1
MEVIKATDSEFKDILAGNSKVIVKYFAGWCGSCRLIAPKFKQLADNQDYADVVFVEVDAEHNPEARTLAKVNNLPFFASFKEGALVEGFPTSKIEAVENMIKAL